jgi:hypothetical protein
MRLPVIVAAAVAVSLAATPAASAYKLAPPGNSAVSQYVENVPGAKGNQPTLAIHSHGGPGSSNASGALTTATQRTLSSQGTDGTRAAAIAAATAPPGVRGVNRRHPGGGATGGPGTGGGATGSGGTTGSTPVSGSVVSPTSAVLKAVTGSATHGLGALLPVILVVSAIGAGLLSVLRRRSAT